MDTLLQFLLVASGGAIGASLRHAVNLAFPRVVGPASGFPWSTLAVNWIGCALIGVLTAGVIERYAEQGAWLRMFWVVGVLGGFTTFSSFALETADLIEERRYAAVTAYVIASNVGCVLLALVSLKLLRRG